MANIQVTADYKNAQHKSNHGFVFQVRGGINDGLHLRVGKDNREIAFSFHA